jgi:SAM-dependent methyltransferase
MRVRAAPDTMIERLGLLLNRVPTPIAESMLGMAISRSLQIAQTTGMLTALAESPRDSIELAEHLGLQPVATKLVLDVIVSLGHVEIRADGRYEMSSRARRWLDPSGEQYVGDFLADSANFWDWWTSLETLVRDGRHVEVHGMSSDDPKWRSYIFGQYQLARLSSDEVARVIPLAPGSRSILDVAGAHGEVSMAICRRHPEIKATVVDLPGSAAIGREIVAEAGMSDRVEHVAGDMFEADLGGPHDGALCFNIVHHLTADRVRDLFARVRKALRPGAPLCVLDVYKRPEGEQPDANSAIGLFFHLSSGADLYTTEEISAWLAGAGFGPAHTHTFRTLPGQALITAKAA